MFKRAVEERVFTIKATVFIKWRTHVNTIKAQRAAMMKIVDKVRACIVILFIYFSCSQVLVECSPFTI